MPEYHITSNHHVKAFSRLLMLGGGGALFTKSLSFSNLNTDQTRHIISFSSLSTIVYPVYLLNVIMAGRRRLESSFSSYVAYTDNGKSRLSDKLNGYNLGLFAPKGSDVSLGW